MSKEVVGFNNCLGREMQCLATVALGYESVHGRIGTIPPQNQSLRPKFFFRKGKCKNTKLNSSETQPHHTNITTTSSFPLLVVSLLSPSPAPIMSTPLTSIPQLSNAGKTAADLASNGSASHTLPHKVQSWSPSSWTTKPIKQDAVYQDRKSVEKSLAKLERLPPIVTPTEIDKLKGSLRDVALGNAFLLQGGDCAELFDYCEENAIESKIKLLLQMSLVLIWGSNKPVVRIARMAGQYAKPRSSPTEIVNGEELPSFRGDILNGHDLDERSLDPSRLVR